MIRILIFILYLFLAVSTITLFAYLDSRISGEAFGYKFDGPSGLIIGGFFALLLTAIYLTHLVKNLMALPAKIKAKEKEARRTRGVAALTRGLEAVAAGDAPGASHHARIARNNLDEVTLTRLLTAQAAQISGDAVAARDSFDAMLEAPETEFVGLKGLFLQAMTAGDKPAARDYADRAFRLRPNARWAFDSVFDLGLERGAWRETRETVAQARRNNLIAADKADRANAVLLTADAYAGALSADKDSALREAKAALKLAPGLAPAALLAARLLGENGKIAKAAKVIESAFAIAPHPALIKAYDFLYAEEGVEQRAALLRKLADKNSESCEATLLRARADNIAGAWSDAIAALEPLLANAPTAAEFALMADAMAGQEGPEAARPWLERAARAPLDSQPGAEGEFHFTRGGWAQLVREYMENERLAPPPFEEISLGMSVDEIRLLTAPKIVDEAPESPLPEKQETANADYQTAGTPTDETIVVAQDDSGDQIQNDEEAERAAAAAREVS